MSEMSNRKAVTITLYLKPEQVAQLEELTRLHERVIPCKVLPWTAEGTLAAVLSVHLSSVLALDMDEMRKSIEG